MPALVAATTCTVALARSAAAADAPPGAEPAPTAPATASPAEAAAPAEPNARSPKSSERAATPGSADSDRDGHARPDSKDPPTATPTGAVPEEFIVDDPAPPEPDRLPRGADTLGGHLQIGVSAGFLSPFGSLESGAAQEDRFSTGAAFALDAGWGIGRTVVLGIAGSYASLGPQSPCRVGTCGGASLGAGPFIRYHLVQGLRFDPWLSFGIGARQTRLDGGASYLGVDWTHLVVGGDWYPFANLGFGPFLDLTLTTFLSRSEGSMTSASVAASFVIGGRVVFDTPGK
jgi:hypothetical protein